MAHTAVRPALDDRVRRLAHPRQATVKADPTSKTTLTVGDVQRFLVIHGRDHWLMRDLLAWIEARRRNDAVPGRAALRSA